MAGLLDIAPVTETVTINGTAVTVTGVSAFGLMQMLSRFPDVRKMIAKRAIDAEALMSIGGEAIGALIAAGTGEPGSPPHEAFAAALPMESQIDLLAAIVRVSLPNGTGPFVAKLTALMSGGVGPSNTGPDMKSRKASKH